MELGDVPDEGRVAAEGHAGDEPLEGRGNYDGHEGGRHLLRQLWQKQAHEEADGCDDSSKDCLLALNEGLPFREGIETAEPPVRNLDIGSRHKPCSRLGSLDLVNIVEVAELRQADDQCKAIAEADHDWSGNQHNQRSYTQQAEDDLDDAHQNDCHEDILWSLATDRVSKQDSDGSCRSADHGWSSTEYRGDKGDDPRRVQADGGRQARRERERYGLGNQCQRHSDAAEDLEADVAPPQPGHHTTEGAILLVNGEVLGGVRLGLGG
mmetsp:Transcript_95955/g.241798  ORF Transcript_95955/g.241798 Transcript_95955/m.241798 type:complete len:266 (-) Transcript_95955:148-945(-)